MKTVDILADWEEPESIKLWGNEVSPPPTMPWIDYINYYVHPDVVSVVGRLLIPAFTEHEGGVFLRDHFTLSGYSRWKSKLSTMSEVEKIINHQHVYDLFSINEKISEQSFNCVANVMCDALKISLSCSFPDKKFHVYTSNLDIDYGPVVGFYSDNQ
ncbi:hypothetical protein AA0242T_0421 [Acetobacter aceti NRIC 0242]|uniref:Uncharacterized protein n=1 Tax=Acetobacter aceti NBRC 14818 TaxID=887700 RepID=A0AB33IGC3_ACEAC|nr:hypothetical protein [Acetobacter aceti]BCK76871.1 hypothetical protein EMQ_2477 [Acetobacter aceti NBRC 14818]GAN56311.1 hypothetical protein Abac_006_039 [Acetobacter aceti NBRC 14818]GBO79719.1 hypothetical protein AA0242T_0421 [Acetobacter aceti NRIC 0242]